MSAFGLLIPTHNPARAIYISPYCGDRIKSGAEECDGTDGITGNETCSQDCTVIEPEQVALSIVKTVDADSAAIGDTVAYTVTISNTGAATAYNVTLNDLLPTDFALAEFDGSTHSWNLGNLAAGKSTTVTYDVTIGDAAAIGTHYNLAVASADDYGTISAKAPLEVTEPSAPVLSVSKTVDDALVSPSASVTYTVTISNSGEGDAINVVLTDTLPAGLTFANKNGSNSGDTEKTWTWDELAAGDDVVVKYKALVDSKAAADVYDNVAEVTADNHKKVSATASTEVRIPTVLENETPELAIKKSVKQPFANPGNTITYTVVVTNTGDAPAVNAVLEDTLPNGFIFVETGTATRTWALKNIIPSDSVTITYDVTIDAKALAGTYINTAVATADDANTARSSAKIEIREVQVLGAEETTELPATGAHALVYVLGTLLTVGSGMLIRKRLW